MEKKRKRERERIISLWFLLQDICLIILSIFLSLFSFSFLQPLSYLCFCKRILLLETCQAAVSMLHLQSNSATSLATFAILFLRYTYIYLGSAFSVLACYMFSYQLINKLIHFCTYFHCVEFSVISKYKGIHSDPEKESMLYAVLFCVLCYVLCVMCLHF